MTADFFRSLHHGDVPLVLVNAWDAASARLVAAAGAPAIATTSAGVAWSLGAPDGDALDRDSAISAVARIVAAVSVPVNADIESGFGATPAEVGDTARMIIEAGAVGVNIEDGLRDPAELCARIEAIRAAVDTSLYVNARIDTFLRGSGDVTETIARAAAYLDAGADGIFVPGVVDPGVIAVLVAAIPAPLNVLVGPGAPTVAELAKLNVARISLGSSVAQAAYNVARRAADEAYRTGTYTSVADAVDYSTMNLLMSRNFMRTARTRRDDGGT